MIKATVVLSDSGFASVSDVVAFGEIKDDSITGKLKSIFGAGSTATAETEDESEKETLARGESGSGSPEETAAASNDAPIEKKEKPKDTIPLVVEVKLSTIPPMSVAEKRTARDR